MNRSQLLGSAPHRRWSPRPSLGLALTAPAGAGAAARGPGCADLPQGGETVAPRPGRLHHPDRPPVLADGTRHHLALRRARRWREATVRCTVTHRTKVIEGIRARVVHDVSVKVDGEIAGEHLGLVRPGLRRQHLVPRRVHPGVRGRRAGQHRGLVAARAGRRPGRRGPARQAAAGCAYREEFLEGEAEDRAKILSTSETITDALRPPPPGPADREHHAVAAGPAGEQVLRPRPGSGAGARPLAGAWASAVLVQDRTVAQQHLGIT